MSKFQADQRKGRAGRESAGKCFRLFTEAAFDKLSMAPLPEVQRANLAQVILQLKVLGVASIESFSFLSPPADMALENAYKSLLMLGAISEVRVLQFFRLSPAAAPFDYLLTHSGPRPVCSRSEDGIAPTGPSVFQPTAQSG